MDIAKIVDRIVASWIPNMKEVKQAIAHARLVFKSVEESDDAGLKVTLYTLFDPRMKDWEVGTMDIHVYENGGIRVYADNHNMHYKGRIANMMGLVKALKTLANDIYQGEGALVTGRKGR